MFPYRRMPWPITALYIFAVVNMLTLFGITIVHADIIVLNPNNATKEVFTDYPAEFSPMLPPKGIQGRLLAAHPSENACTRIDPPPNDSDYFVLVQRYGCSFQTKAKNIIGYKAVILYNSENNEISSSSGPFPNQIIDIPTVLVAGKDGLKLRDHYLYKHGYEVVITSDLPFNLNNYLFPFAVVIAVCFVIMCIFSIVKCYRDRKRSRANKLPAKQLKKIPVKKFQKGDDFDLCAICLDDYKEGEKLRVLPCSHAYHAKCIDPWLTNNKRTCPVCKRKVFVGDDSCNDDENDSETEGSESNENTPLLPNSQPSGSRNYGYNRSLLSHARESAQNRDQTEESGLPSTSARDDEVIIAIAPSSHSLNGDEQLHESDVQGRSNYVNNINLMCRAEEAIQNQKQIESSEDSGLPLSSAPEDELTVVIGPLAHSVNGDEQLDESGAVGMSNPRPDSRRKKKKSSPCGDLVV